MVEKPENLPQQKGNKSHFIISSSKDTINDSPPPQKTP